MQITVKVPGSCGELAQGFYKGEPFLITCPINIFSEVIVTDKSRGLTGLNWKSEKMFFKTLKYIGVEEFNFGVKLKSDLPIAKGLASSSADIAAVAKAISLAVNFDLSAETICRLAAQIEPTDSTFVEGIVAVNPVNGKILKYFEPLPNYKIAIFDFGGTVNTIEQNRRSDFTLHTLPDRITSDLIIKSALANQKVLHKSQLENIIEFAMSAGALAVNAAHSGTVIGIFFEDTSIVENIISKFTHIKLLCITELISGGFF